MAITEQQYESALRRIEELLPLVSDNTPLTDANAVELIRVSEIVREYELKHYPIGESKQS
jgi:HTH-type transcriptional regulator/antitoxin HigA